MRCCRLAIRLAEYLICYASAVFKNSRKIGRVRQPIRRRFETRNEQGTTGTEQATNATLPTNNERRAPQLYPAALRLHQHHLT